MESKDMKWLYDTVLSTPGMEDTVKLDFRVSRKLVLLLAQVIERGLTVQGNGLPESVDAGLLDELQAMAALSLEKAGLTQLDSQLRKKIG